MFVDVALLLASVFPRAEDPWPDTIGIGLPFTLAGAGGLVADWVSGETEAGARDRVVRVGSLFGFRLGATFYVPALVNQLAFSL